MGVQLVGAGLEIAAGDEAGEGAVTLSETEETTRGILEEEGEKDTAEEDTDCPAPT